MAHTRIVPNQPALILEGRERCMVVADLHIGFESALAANEVFLDGGASTREAIGLITALIARYRIDTLVLLGDVKSTVGRISAYEWRYVPLFLEEVCRVSDTVLVPGNHDGSIHRLVPSQVAVAAPAGLVLEDTLLTHGHVMPSGSSSHVSRIVMGHIHPAFLSESSVLGGQRVWVSIRSRKERIFHDRAGAIEVLVVPSFNGYFFATRRRGRERSTSPIVERVREGAMAKIVTLDGTIIGDETILCQVI